MSIASEITRIDNAKASLKASLEAKGATVSDDAKIDAYPSILDDIPVALLQDKEVNVSGGTTLIEPDQGYTGLHSVSVTAESGEVSDVVFFYDYEGTLVESYTGAEIQALSALPNAPDHSQDEVPLTFDEWNWTLNEIKTYNASYPTANINVGAVYHPTDGNIHIFFRITQGDELGVSISYNTSTGTSSVNWGDGITESKGRNHVYSDAGLYHCILESPTSYLTLGGSSNYDVKYGSKIEKLFVSSNVSITVRNCINIQELVYSNSGTTLSNDSFNNCAHLKALIIPRGYTTIGNSVFLYMACAKIISIPNTVTSIGTDVFRGCSNLESITIPSGITSISSNFLNACYNIKSVVIPNSVTSIYNYAFQYCYCLKSVSMPEDITDIYYSAFESCHNLESIRIPKVSTIPGNIFKNCYSLISITIPDTVTSIGEYAFQNCKNLKSITIPTSVTSINSGAFDSCSSLVSLNIPSSVTTLGSGVAQSCTSLRDITLGRPSRLPATMLNSCKSIQSIVIPDSVTTIENSAFQGCGSIQSITIPASVTTINGSPFNNCYSAYSVTLLPTTPPTLSGNGGFSTSYQKKFYVPYSADHSILEAYKSASNWSDFSSIMEELPE